MPLSRKGRLLAVAVLVALLLLIGLNEARTSPYFWARYHRWRLRSEDPSAKRDARRALLRLGAPAVGSDYVDLLSAEVADDTAGAVAIVFVGRPIGPKREGAWEFQVLEVLHTDVAQPRDWLASPTLVAVDAAPPCSGACLVAAGISLCNNGDPSRRGDVATVLGDGIFPIEHGAKEVLERVKAAADAACPYNKSDRGHR